jgi:hypothetical protein
LVKPSPKIEAISMKIIINHTLTLSASGGVNYLWQGPINLLQQMQNQSLRMLLPHTTEPIPFEHGGNSCTNYAQLKVALAMPLGFEGEINQSLSAFLTQRRML